MDPKIIAGIDISRLPNSHDLIKCLGRGEGGGGMIPQTRSRGSFHAIHGDS